MLAIFLEMTCRVLLQKETNVVGHVTVIVSFHWSYYAKFSEIYRSTFAVNRIAMSKCSCSYHLFLDDSQYRYFNQKLLPILSISIIFLFSYSCGHSVFWLRVKKTGHPNCALFRITLERESMQCGECLLWLVSKYKNSVNCDSFLSPCRFLWIQNKPKIVRLKYRPSMCADNWLHSLHMGIGKSYVRDEERKSVESWCDRCRWGWVIVTNCL